MAGDRLPGAAVTTGITWPEGRPEKARVWHSLPGRLWAEYRCGWTWRRACTVWPIEDAHVGEFSTIARYYDRLLFK